MYKFPRMGYVEVFPERYYLTKIAAKRIEKPERTRLPNEFINLCRRNRFDA